MKKKKTGTKFELATIEGTEKIWLQDEDEKIICDFREDADEKTMTLLAAAPDLLEACKDANKLLNIAKKYFPKSIKNSDTYHLLNVQANSIQKAINKAEGV